MSLLLDALKKAATEKEKHKSLESTVSKTIPEIEVESDAPEIDSSYIDVPEALDLDLDLADNNDQLPELEEVDNEADYSMRQPVVENTTVMELEKHNDNSGMEVPEIVSEEVVLESAASKIDDTTEKDLFLEEDESPAIDNQNDQINGIATDSKINNKQDDTESLETAEPPEIVEQAETVEPIDDKVLQMDAKYESEIKNKEALSALINKSNSHTRKKNLQIKIMVTSIVAIILMLTIIFLYLEFSAESQNIYIVDDKNQPQRAKIERNIQSVQTADILADNVKENISPVKSKVAEIDRSSIKKASKVVVPVQPVKTKIIEIKHKSEKDPIGVIVRRAFNAFNQQDYKTSELLYLQAYAAEPRNRDVLLGLAAIAVKQERYEYARQKYSQLRYLNPRDSLAIAGLSSIQQRINSELSESEIKNMLRDQPDAAHLYFALGSIYASQKKWADAQASFFSAWSAENTNADYAYNLAVSLDQLGKKVQAKQLYESSVKLNQAKKGNFSVEIVKKRIETLNDHK